MKDNLNDNVNNLSEQILDNIPMDVRIYFLERKTEKDLADAFAIASNKFYWISDNVYDYEEGTFEYKATRTITTEWCALMNEYEERIFEILRSEGIIIPKIGRINILKSFMKRNGYLNGNGWWIKDKESL